MAWREWINVPALKRTSHHLTALIAVSVAFRLVGWVFHYTLQPGSVGLKLAEGIEIGGHLINALILVIVLIRRTWVEEFKKHDVPIVIFA